MEARPAKPVSQGFRSLVAQGFSPAIPRRFATLCLPILLFGGCNAAPSGVTADVTGDAASRLVAEVSDGAARLTHSPSDTLVLSVSSRSSPGGCPDGYRVEWRADSDRIPGLGVVCTTGTRGYASIAYRTFVKVPRPLQVTKKNGDPLTVALHKRTDGVIEVTALQ
jgi:hypothetical protein